VITRPRRQVNLATPLVQAFNFKTGMSAYRNTCFFVYLCGLQVVLNVM
jgi:hypothetical protein